MDVSLQVWQHLQPDPAVRLSPDRVTVIVLLAVAAVAVPRVWRVIRIAVTLVHELGHAVVGVAAGRRFTGFVVRGDMSGHTVTVGPARGIGRVLTTWAGYPAPAVLGAVLMLVASTGWSAPVLAGSLLVLLLALPRARSGLTAVVVLGALTALGWLWWSGSPQAQAHAMLGGASVLLAGAWRHLVAVIGSPDPRSDPAVLATLTHLPRMLWSLSFTVVLAGATCLATLFVLTSR